MKDNKYEILLNYTKNFITWNYNEIEEAENTSNALDFVYEIKQYLEKTYKI